MHKRGLDPTTTLTTNRDNQTIITHKGQTYNITLIQNETIGGIEFHRYKNQQCEEFIHIPGQDKLIPPYITPWYALPSNTEVYLRRDYKEGLIRQAVKIAGGETKLRRTLAAEGMTSSNTFLYKHLHDLRDGMSEDKLIPILNYLGMNLDEVNDHINAIGHCRAIEHPNLPFNLNSEDGARLMGARFSDGTNCAPKGRGPRFDYSNNDVEQRNRIIESLQNIFGGANILDRQHANGEVAQVRTSTDIIGYTLQRAGGITGDITQQNPHIPTWIQHGPSRIKREWLVQAFGDEGYNWGNRGKVCLGRTIELASVLSRGIIRRLDQLAFQAKIIHGRKVCGLRSCKYIPTDIYEVIKGHPPNLLEEETAMLGDLRIASRRYPQELHRGKNGDYSAHWVLQTETREDGRRFANEIGFPQERKQEKLILAMRLDQ